MVQKQTLYISVLAALTAGFILGAAYSSFQLAGQAPARQAQAPHAGADNAGADNAGADNAGADNAGADNTAGTGASQPSADMAAAQAGAEILALETFLKENPDNADAWIRLGNHFYDINRFSEAIKAYEKSLALVPGNSNVLTDMGVMYRRNKEPEKSVQAFDRAIAADPSHEAARFNKGVVLMHDLNDFPGAIRAWEGLVGVNPGAQAPNGQLVSDMIKAMKQKQ